MEEDNRFNTNSTVGLQNYDITTPKFDGKNFKMNINENSKTVKTREVSPHSISIENKTHPKLNTSDLNRSISENKSKEIDQHIMK